jgi:phosphate transport system permease protein
MTRSSLPDTSAAASPPGGGGGLPGRRRPTGGLPGRRRWGVEALFRTATTAAGASILVIIVAIAVFLVVKAVPGLRANTANFLTYRQWYADSQPPAFGIAATAFGTVLTACLALLMAVPVALGIALCLSHYAPRRLAGALGFAVDLLAAVPSVVFGLWGRDYLAGPVRELSAWLHRTLGFVPVFGSGGPYGKSVLLGSMVLAIMVLPIITSLSREVFRQTPRDAEEAAIALGATRWEVVRTAVLPHARAGVIAAVMLGLGRALGETIALALTLGSVYTVSFDLLGPGGNTIAANIANRFGEAGGVGQSALIASGLVLFAITLVVNMLARLVIFRRRHFVAGTA